jgi:hypothetical protein
MRDTSNCAEAQDATASSSINSVTAEKIPAKTRGKDKFDRYAWRDDVFADPATPQNAKCLAFGITKFANAETGEAYPSTRTLAEVCGMSQAWVRKTIPVLRNTGWIDVELGSRGRGEKHCNRFRINPEKSTPCALLSVPEKSTPAGDQDAVKEHFSPLKEHPCAQNLSNPKEELKDRVPSTTTSESAAQPRALSIESLLVPREVTPKQDAAPFPAKSTEVNATVSLSTTEIETARLEALSLELEEKDQVPKTAGVLKPHRFPIETPEGLLPLTGVSCNGAAAKYEVAADLGRAANAQLTAHLDDGASLDQLGDDAGARGVKISQPTEGAANRDNLVPGRDKVAPAHPDLDEAGADAHVSHNDNDEEQAMFVDADGHFPRAGRYKPERHPFRRYEPPTASYADTLAPPRTPREKAFAALWQAYPRYPRNCSDADCERLFNALLDEGIAADDLIIEAAEYARRLPKGAEPRLMRYWLKVRCWMPEKRAMAA